MKNLADLAAICRGRTVYIQTHNFPDPDAIASAFGLQNLLKDMGIPSKICYAGRIDKLSAAKMLDILEIEMYSYGSVRDQMEESDYIICVDSQKNGGNITDFVGDEVACIDHHPVYENVFYKYADFRSTGACATIITDYYICAGKTPDVNTATALLYGIKMDTLQFTRGVTDKDIEMFRYLYSRSDLEKLTRLERNNMELKDLKAYGAAIENIKLYDTAGFSFIPFSCPDALIGILADFILALDEVEIAVVSSEREDGIKISVRSEISQIKADILIRAALDGFGNAGGHSTMAAGLIPKEKVPLLGNYPKEKIDSLFLEALTSMN